jgi:hypothetical protein
LLDRLQCRNVLAHLFLLGSKLFLLGNKLLYAAPHGGEIARDGLELLHQLAGSFSRGGRLRLDG